MGIFHIFDIFSLVDAIVKMGFTEMTAVQAAAIPEALMGRDVLGYFVLPEVFSNISSFILLLQIREDWFRQDSCLFDSCYRADRQGAVQASQWSELLRFVVLTSSC